MTKTYAPLNLSGLALMHLGIGCCLISGGCELCTDSEEEDSRWILHYEGARKLWEQHREHLIATWAQQLSDRGEPGLSTLPMFAQCLFDHVPLPRCDPSWPSHLQDRHRMIEQALHEVRERRRTSA